MAHRKKRFFFIPVIIIAVLCLMSFIVLLLWNSILPGLINVRRITFPEAMGILVLCKILFGSFRPGPPGGFRRGGPPWKTKLMDMSPEEREQFRRQWEQRCGLPKKED